MCVCVHVHVSYMCVYIRIHVCVYVCTNMYIHIYTHVYTYMHVYVCITLIYFFYVKYSETKCLKVQNRQRSFAP